MAGCALRIPLSSGQCPQRLRRCGLTGSAETTPRPHENGTDRSGQALDLAEEVKPDLVLLDALLPDG
jgi:hypothetical protein